MATAKVETLLPLDTFAHLLQIHPLHFNQVYQDDMPPCGMVWLQYGWQSDNCSSREEVAIAIDSAENDLEQFLGFPVAPKWFEDQLVPYIGPRLTLPKAHYIMGGKRRTLRISAGASITYSGDVGTITVTTDVDINEIAIVYPGEDFADWRIRGISVVRSGGDVIITVKRCKLVTKDLLENYIVGSLIYSENANFLDTIDVYRIYNDPATQLAIQSISRSCCSTCGGCYNCDFTINTGCMRGFIAEEGIVDISAATWEDDSFTYTSVSGVPYQVRAHFKAGWPLVNGEMYTMWQLAVARLALTRLSTPLCNCPSVKRRVDWWTEDLGKGIHKIPSELKNSPWGYTRGALYAYSVANKHRKAQGNC